MAMPIQRGAFIFLGLAVPALSASFAASEPLTLARAIALATENNLSITLARAGNEEARGRAMASAAGLLPRLTGTFQQTRVFKSNLEAQGFPADGPFNPLLGPYNSFDARVRLVQNLFDANAFWLRRLGKTNRRISLLQEKLAREQVAAAAALAFLETQRARRTVEAAQGDFTLSESLLKLARDQHQAGVSSGIDVARADTHAALQKLRLIRAQVAAREAELRLKRVIGLPLAEAIILADAPRHLAQDLPAAEAAVAQALRDRWEVRLAAEHVQAARDQRRLAEGEHWPTLVALADYGHSGPLPDNTARTGFIGGRLDLPIFSGRSTEGRQIESAAAHQEAEARHRDTCIQVEEDIRLSRETLLAEVEEVATAEKAVELARKELTLSRNRFSSGIGDNIQLLSAQTAFGRALDDQVGALARYDTARVNWAVALGQAAEFK